jgi:hypothetical protein
VKCCIRNIAFYGAEKWTPRKVDQKYLENFELWCWRRMVGTMRKESNVVHTIKGRKANRICPMLRRNSLLKHIIEGKIEGGIKVTERQG